MRNLWHWLREPLPVVFPRGLWMLAAVLIVNQWVAKVWEGGREGIIAAIPICVVVGILTYRALDQRTAKPE